MHVTVKSTDWLEFEIVPEFNFSFKKESGVKVKGTDRLLTMLEGEIIGAGKTLFSWALSSIFYEM